MPARPAGAQSRRRADHGRAHRALARGLLDPARIPRRARGRGRRSSATSSAASPPRACRPNKADLVGLSTEAGPVAGSTLYLLKRFYLDTPGRAWPATPARASAPPGCSRCRVPSPTGCSRCSAGLPRTAIYALLAAAYALVFGLVGRINLAFGELAALGAAATAVGVALLLSLGAGGAPRRACCSGRLRGVRRRAPRRRRRPLDHRADRRPQRAAEPDRDRRAVARADGVSAPRPEPATVWLPPIWSEAWPLLRSGDFVVSLTPVSLLTTAIGLGAGGAVLSADAALRLRPRLAGLCGRRQGGGALRRRRAPPPDPHARPERRARRALGRPRRAAVWRPRLRRRLPARPEGAHRGGASAASARSPAPSSAASPSASSRRSGRHADADRRPRHRPLFGCSSRS